MNDIKEDVFEDMRYLRVGVRSQSINIEEEPAKATYHCSKLSLCDYDFFGPVRLDLLFLAVFGHGCSSEVGLMKSVVVGIGIGGDGK